MGGLFTLRSDGLYNAEGNIYMQNSKYISIQKLIPPIYELYGTLRIDNNNLTTLKGCPMYIDGNFDCSYNCLKTLDGGPYKVTKDYECHHNSLESLEGAPSYIGERFWFFANPTLRITMSQLAEITIGGKAEYDSDQIIPNDPSEYLKRGLLPI